MTKEHAQSNRKARLLSDEIERLYDEMSKLELQRRGLVVWDKDDQPLYAYCVGCGRSTVDVNRGFDTCSECLSTV